MLRSLTKSRTPDYHRQTMLKLIIAVALWCIFWEPIRPIRNVTADVLYTAGDLIRR